MTYNFDEIIPRRNTHSIKWDLDSSGKVTPFWVADMDFKTCPAVLRALQKRVAHGVFGYTFTPDDYYEAIVTWWNKRHHFNLEKEWLVPVTGIIPGTSAIIRALCEPGNKIIVQSPVYNHFYETIANCGRGVVENVLLENKLEYTIDYDSLEQQCADPKVKLFMLCNPHNPIGRCWNKEELLRIGEICFKHDVLVIADEIHCDLVFADFQHVPFASLGEEFSMKSITCASPSKAFNLAGIQSAYLFSSNSYLNDIVADQLGKVQESNMLNPFAIEALIAAYLEGEDWLDELKDYLYSNYQYVKDFLASHLPHIRLPELQATYLLWLDCRAVVRDSSAFVEKLKNEQHIWLNPGDEYGQGGNGFLRLNIGCPKIMLEEAMEKLKTALK